ncbi:large ribosomal subunit protein uL18c isoform X2 [Magnolia sinica]|uniref:large ribosomal subunit protein uL18c isoform X2 n=1 Tax=Magnolia sinica TaxID=86752 RepID=UPI00265AD2A9|nr:large ribosomal subunit protein uL18c isoform X2 [Magnolia sinica]
MALVPVPLPQFSASSIFQTRLNSFSRPSLSAKNTFPKHLVITSRANTRKESAKVRNRRLQRKFNGTSAKPRLSVFCSTKQLYAMLVDDQNKKCLFYGSTLQKSIRDNPACSTVIIWEKESDHAYCNSQNTCQATQSKTDWKPIQSSKISTTVAI